MGYKEKRNGYLTIYLSLVLSILLSLCLTLIEGARKGAVRFESELVVNIGINSILAEYHRELFKQYNLFAIDDSYGTGLSSIHNTTEHLREYLDRNMTTDDLLLSGRLYRDFLGMETSSVQITGAVFLTDEDGAVFRRRAAEAMYDDVGLSLASEVVDQVAVIRAYNLEEDIVGEGLENVNGELQEALGEITEHGELPDEYDNPISSILDKRSQGILSLALGSNASVSGKEIRTGTLACGRRNGGNLNHGNLESTTVATYPQNLEWLFFQEYLMRYFGHYLDDDSEDALEYQIEYLIAGKEADSENLKNIASRLLIIRGAADYLYLLSDEGKCAEAEMIAAIVSALILMPELTDLFTQIILLGWAYMESVYDLKTIFAGGKIPLMKTAETWHYSLANALLAPDDSDSRGTGLGYKDYLRIFLYLTDNTILSFRAMDLMESDIRLTPGNESFRMDACVDELRTDVTINSSYGYSTHLVRQKSYAPIY